MPTFRYDKLVRDKIPKFHENCGHTVAGITLDGAALRRALVAKLREEADEVAAATTRSELIEEIADAKQVLVDLCANEEISPDEIERARLAKLEKKGGFVAGHYIKTVTIPNDDDKWAKYCRRDPLKYPEVGAVATFITGNQNKANYLAQTLGMAIEHKKLDLDEIQSTSLREIVEHKAEQAYRLINKPVIVEDNSLEFAALDGLPGPFIKFFVEQSGTEKLCRLLDGFSDRSATAKVGIGHFDGQEFTYFESSIAGKIATNPRGAGGFGWDAVFETDDNLGQTNAELNKKEYAAYYEKLRSVNKLRDFLKKV